MGSCLIRKRYNIIYYVLESVGKTSYNNSVLIDTGVPGNQIGKISTKNRSNGNNASGYYCRSGGSVYDANGTNGIFSGCGNVSGGSGRNQWFGLGRDYNDTNGNILDEVTFSGGNGSGSYYSNYQSSNTTSSATVSLFTLHNGTNYNGGYSPDVQWLGHFAYFKIGNRSNVQIRNMYAVKRKSDNAVGMYDTINKVFYQNNNLVAGQRIGFIDHRNIIHI